MVVGNFWCVDCTCGKTNHSERSFTAEVEDADSKEEIFCPNDEDVKLKLMGIKGPAIVTGDNKAHGRSAKEKAQRRKTSFHDQVSTQMQLDATEKRHFGKKFGRPK